MRPAPTTWPWRAAGSCWWNWRGYWGWRWAPPLPKTHPHKRSGPSEAAIEALIEQRKAAKAARDYAEADRIRNELKAQGIELVDKPGGVTVWVRG